MRLIQVLASAAVFLTAPVQGYYPTPAGSIHTEVVTGVATLTKTVTDDYVYWCPVSRLEARCSWIPAN